MKNVLSWFLRHANADAALPERMLRLLAFLREARPALKEIAATHCEVAEMLARQLGFPKSVQRTLQLANGLSNRAISKELVISEKTVEHHLKHIYGKLGVSSRTSAVVFAVQNGIVT